MNIFSRASSAATRKVGKEVDFRAILGVYESQDGAWKAFAYPYGETTEADSKDEALTQIRDLTKAYEEIIDEYSSPSHLTNVGLCDEEDKKVLNSIIFSKENMNKILNKGVVDVGNCYAEAYGV